YCPPPWCYFYCIFFSDAPTTEIYTLSLHDALPIYQRAGQERAHEVDLDGEAALDAAIDHTLDDFLFFEGLFEAGPGAGALGLLRSEEHTSELQSRENLVCRLLLEKKKNYY